MSTPGSPARPAITVAAIGSAVAGVVHAAAAGNHEGETLLVWLFSACAGVQLGWGWALAAAGRPQRQLLRAGLAINGGAVLVWALTHTVGIGVVDALATPEPIGAQDLVAALAATVSVTAVVTMLLRPVVVAALTPAWTGLLAASAFLVVLPALAAGHEHGGDAHDHADSSGEVADGDHGHEEAALVNGHDHSTGTSTSTTMAGGHDHQSGATLAAHDDHSATTDPTVNHGHTDTSDTTDTTVGHDHPPSTTSTTLPHEHEEEPPIISLDDPRLTDDQVEAAVALIVGTMTGMSGYTTVEDVVAAGYESIGDGGAPGQYEHFVRWAYLSDAYELDPGHVEAIVVKMNADGTKRVVAAMYTLTAGESMSNAPDIAGTLTTWHDHDNLCFDGGVFVGLAVGGTCATGALFDTPPMLHVWIEATPCGPFGVIDELGHDCGASHTH